ncbi:MAG: FIST N-terminal domain-containing protein [Myxococcota bacterium]
MRAFVGYAERSDPTLAGRLAAAAASGPIGRKAVRTLILFAIGPHASSAEQVAEGAQEHCPDASIAVVGGAGAMVPEGEMQGIGAVVALALRSPSKADVCDEGEIKELGATLHHRPARPTLFFGRRSLSPERLATLEETSGAWALAGGAVDPAASLAVGDPAEGEEDPGGVRHGALLGIRIDGGLRMAIETSVAVHPIGPPRKVTEVDGGYVLRLDGHPPLSLLGRAVEDRDDRPLVLVRWQPEDAPAPLVRGIGGLDPQRGAVFVGPDVKVGDQLEFCVPDAQAGRDDLRSALDRVKAGVFGGIPVAAIVIESVGRGVRLHGKPHVDARTLRRELGDVPFVGVRTTQEIVRAGDELRIAGHTMVVALLFAPS